MTDARPVPRRRRRWPVPVAVIVSVAVYAVVVLLYAGSFRDSADLCNEPPESASGTDYLEVLLTPTAVHATSERIDLEVRLQPSDTLLDGDGFTATRDLGLLLFPVDGEQVVPLKAGDVLATTTKQVLASGTVEQWPFDTYRSTFTAVGFTGTGDDRLGLETYVCMLGSVPGWDFTVTEVAGANQVETAAGTQIVPDIALTATRSASTVAFGVVLLGLMAVLPALVLFVAISAYLGRRKVEATLTSWIGAMLFATIPLRNFLPGSPPVGSWIDYLIVLWVIVGLVAGLTIYIMAWNRWGTRVAPRGSPPPPDPLD